MSSNLWYQIRFINVKLIIPHEKTMVKTSKRNNLNSYIMITRYRAEEGLVDSFQILNLMFSFINQVWQKMIFW